MEKTEMFTKLQQKKSVGSKCRWEDKIKIILIEMGFDGVSWLDLAAQWLYFVKTVEGLQFSQ
jgi:hypothetical protein